MSNREVAEARAAVASAFAEGSRVILGLSGGPDSLGLAALLADVASQRRLVVQALHVDHGLRAGSADEAERARGLAQSLGLPCEVVKVAPVGDNVQSAARAGRLAALCEAATRCGARAIALAHTADDQAETVLMRLLRGSGSAGLAAMQPRRALPGGDLELVRPLLGTRRATLEALLAERGLAPLRDPSNDSDAYLRNRLRRRVMPLLVEENPRAIEALCRAARTAAEEHAALSEVAVAELGRLRADAPAPPEAGERLVAAAGGETARTQARGLSRSGLRALGAGLRHHVLRAAFAEVTGSLRRLDRGHVEAADALIETAAGGSLALPGATLWVEADIVWLECGARHRSGHR